MSKPGSLLDALGDLQFGWFLLKWLAAGPLLITIGVTQAVYGWAGNSLWMRYGYSTACILFGLSIFAFFTWIVVTLALPEKRRPRRSRES